MQGELPYAVTIMYLNVCGGKWFDELTAWLVEFKKQGRLPDVLCFQEVLDNPLGIAWSNEQPEIGTQRADLWNQFRILFPGYRGFIAPFSMLSVSFPMDIGNATFVRRGISTPRHWDEMVFRERDSVEGLDVSTLPRNVLGVELNVGGKPLHVLNFHGLWNGIHGKADFRERTEQFERLANVADQCEGPVVLGGDVNNGPGGDASKIFTERGFTDLVLWHNIPSTRSTLYPRTHKGLHADNVFTRGVKVLEFKVLQNVAVSDHLPLLVQVAI